jgi:phage terminase Nu1 subunit (DNA packaging protein)
MNATQYVKELERLGLTSQECAKLFSYSHRTSQRWDRTGPPISVAAVLKAAKDKADLVLMIRAAK